MRVLVVKYIPMLAASLCYCGGASLVPGQGCGVAREIKTSTVLASALEPLARNRPEKLQCGGVTAKPMGGK